MLQYGTHEEDELWVDLHSCSGTYVHSLMNEPYWNKQGIFTYKIELYGDECLINTWRHQLYVERIHIGQSS
jgi:hypothetical protein